MTVPRPVSRGISSVEAGMSENMRVKKCFDWILLPGQRVEDRALPEPELTEGAQEGKRCHAYFGFQFALFIFIFFLCVGVLCLNASECTASMPGTHRGHRAQDLLELELRTVVSNHA